jgi:hypothetical protein|nr:MAG TPA: hypothetical protein [Caudoviricetes sp.]
MNRETNHVEEELAKTLQTLLEEASRETAIHYPEWRQRTANRVENGNWVSAFYREKGDEIVEVLQVKQEKCVYSGVPTLVWSASGAIFSEESKYPRTILIYKRALNYVATKS